MANIKFSGFTAVTDIAGIQEIVGYNGTANVRISPVNFINSSGGPYLPLVGGTMVGAITMSGADDFITFNVNNAAVFDNSNNNNPFYIRNSGGNAATLQIGTGSPGGNVKFLIEGGGNVGIGANSPTVGLQLGNSVSGETKLAIFNSEGGGEVGLTIKSRTNRAKLRVSDNDSNAYVVAEAGKAFFGASANGDTNNITVLTGGNVGIGTTAPSEKLEVQDGNIKIETTTNLDAKLILNPYSDGLGTSYQWNINGRGSAGNYAFQISEGTTPYLTIGNSAGGGGGNVGIGTTSPERKLHVQSGSAGTVTSSSETQLVVESSLESGISLLSPDDRQSSLYFGSPSDNIGSQLAWRYSTKQLVLGTAVTSGGEISIRTGNNSEKLKIFSNGSLQFNSYNDSNNTGTATFLLGTDANGNVVKTTTVPSGSGGPFLPLAGGTMTGDLLVNLTGGYFEVDKADNRVKFADNTRATFGTGQDLQIYHDGSNSFINNEGLGSLIVRATNFAVQSADGTDDFITTVQNAQVNLFYNGSKKFETTNTGVTVTGNVTLSSALPLLYLTNTTASTGKNWRLSSATNGKFFIAEEGVVDAVTLDSTTGNATFAGNVVLSNTGDPIFDIYRDGGSGHSVRLHSEGVSWINNNNNFGIGTTTPASKLEVDGDVLIKSGEYISWGTAGVTAIEGSTASNKIAFLTNSTEKMRLTSAGNVGIGTTTPDAGALLDVRGVVQAKDSYFLAGMSNTKGYNFHDLGTGWGFKALTGPSRIAIFTDTLERLTVLTNGNIGIGTTSPASKLEVDGGDIEVDDSASGLILKSPDGTRYRVTVANGGTLSVAAV